MDLDHFDQIPKSVRREPINLSRPDHLVRFSIVVAMVPVALAVIAAVFIFFATPALPRDLGQWQATDADVSKWFRELRQPDNEHMSCCGQSDAYYADSFEITGDQYIAIITDERDDAPLGRPHIPPGTRIVVPNAKLKYDAGNPTGHGVIFIGSQWQVFCYVAPGGV